LPARAARHADEHVLNGKTELKYSFGLGTTCARIASAAESA
jgi:hypothetical protein